MKTLIIAATVAFAFPALAQSSADSGSSSAAIVSPGSINSPVVNIGGSPSQVRNDFHGNTAASPATVFVNGAANDTCAMPGDAISLQVVGGGFGGSKGGAVAVGCETRQDALVLRALGASATLIKARLCANPNMAAAYELDGQPCPVKTPQQAKAMPKPWEAGG